MIEAKPPGTPVAQSSHATGRDAANFLLVIALAVVALTGLPAVDAPAEADAAADELVGSSTPVTPRTPRARSAPYAMQPERTVRNSGVVAPQMPTTRPPTLCQTAAEAGVQPVNGKELLDHDRSGVGKLHLENGTGYPGVGVLIDTSTRRPFRAMYIHASSTATMLRVNPGTYRLQFALGRTWLEGDGRFCQTIGVSEFERLLEFSEVTTAEGVRYDVIEVTFHKTEGGNARTRDLSPEAFALTWMAKEDGE